MAFTREQMAFANMTGGMVDSALESTRVYWRKKFFNASDDEARDPRPFAEVLAARAQGRTEGNDG